MKNYAPKLYNVARGPKAQGYHCTTEGHNFSVLIEANSQYLFCYITENIKELNIAFRTQTGNSHTFSFEKHVFQFFANDYIIFAFLNSLKYVKYKRKRLFKPF